MGIMNDKPTVKEHCENWGRKHGIIMTADQHVEELKAENVKLKTDIQYMVEKAADKSLDGYREMGEKLADMETRNERLEAEIAKLQKKRPIAECQCADCGETMYFYKLGPARCACGGAELELTVNTTILED